MNGTRYKPLVLKRKGRRCSTNIREETDSISILNFMKATQEEEGVTSSEGYTKIIFLKKHRVIKPGSIINKFSIA